MVFLRTLFDIGLEEERELRYGDPGGRLTGEIGVSVVVDSTSFDLQPALVSPRADKPEALYLLTTEMEALQIARQIAGLASSLEATGRG